MSGTPAGGWDSGGAGRFQTCFRAQFWAFATDLYTKEQGQRLFR